MERKWYLLDTLPVRLPNGLKVWYRLADPWGKIWFQSPDSNEEHSFDFPEGTLDRVLMNGGGVFQYKPLGLAFRALPHDPAGTLWVAVNDLQ